MSAAAPAATVLAAIARALALVLAFAMLRENRFRPTLSLSRLHLAVTAIALLAGAPPAAGALAAGVLAGATALLAAVPLGALAARTGGPESRPASVLGGVASIASGLALTALALSLAGALRSEAVAVSLSIALLGLVLAVRPGGGDAAALARLAVLGDGIALLAASLGSARGQAIPAAAPVAGVLLMPAMLLIGRATLGRAGGIGGS